MANLLMLIIHFVNHIYGKILSSVKPIIMHVHTIIIYAIFDYNHTLRAILGYLDKRTEFDIRKLYWLICVYHYRSLTIMPL
jgi:hypothetical protein